MKKIAKGAEAVLLKDNGNVLKDRIKKSYRLPEIDDKVRKRRTKTEASLLRAAKRAGINVPAVSEMSETSLGIEFINGNKLRDVLGNENAIEIGEQIGIAIGKLHTYDIIHGDLTTSNMIISGNDLYFIDFGLGFQSKRIEDKAIDLYVLWEALESTHNKIKDILWVSILKAYAEHFDEAKKVIKTLHEIEKRGRYRNRVG